MRIAVIGSSGQLGVDLMAELPRGGAGHEVIGFSGRAELDICDAAAVAAMLDRVKPAAVINTAAFHNVDLCEKEAEAAYRTNVIAVRELAKLCEAAGVWFFQIGTDYVVEGWPECRPVAETAAVHPASIYALTRFGGDCMTLAQAPTCGYVVRSCGLFGVAGCKLKGGLNFVDLMIKMAWEGKKLKVVDDQTVAPTPTDDLAKQLRTMIERAAAGRAAAAGSQFSVAGSQLPVSGSQHSALSTQHSGLGTQHSALPPGLYHAVSHGAVTWYAFAKRALELAGLEKAAAEMEPVASSVYAAPAKRPRYSVLDNAKLRAAGLDVMGTWEEGLKRYVAGKYGGS